MSQRLKRIKCRGKPKASCLAATQILSLAVLKTPSFRSWAWLASYLDEEEAGGGGRVVVDVHGDQHAGDHDERDQQDAEDEADVQGLVRAWDPVHGAVGRHHWRTNGNTDNQRSWQQERVTQNR